MNDIPNDIINDAFGQIYYLLPLPFIAIILGISIWLGFTKISGEVKKGYRLYNSISAIVLAVISYYTIPVDKLVVYDIPTLIVSMVGSGVAIEIFVFRRKKKGKK